MSKSLTLSCGGTVDYRLHLGYNEQYRAPIHKIQHVFADTVYGIIDQGGQVGELFSDAGTISEHYLYAVSINKKIGDYTKEI